ncbi:MAG: ATP phosphoribosyltransferase regulatory subunit [Spirochaetes bacterium]|nr:ATP phosphoribosyltransferase regulatory subunit [Spirochaetota bacterium]
MHDKSNFLHTPPGTRPFFKGEAIFRKKIEKKLSQFFEQWNFFPLEPPIIDYFDAYASFLSDEQKRGSIRFINRDGSLVLLRNDLTLFTAKFVASRLYHSEEILRYYYADSIIRCQEKDAPEEYYQIGCEIVDDHFTYHQLELIVMLLESIAVLNIDSTRLYIGDVSFYQQILSDLDPDDLHAVFALIRYRNRQALDDKLTELKISQGTKNDCLTACRFIGTAAQLAELSFSKEAKKAIAPLSELVNHLCQLGYEEQVIINLGEMSNLDYYNGIIFHLYTDGVESPLASGGRYDMLYQHLGLNKSAVGFSYWLYPLEKCLFNKMVESNGFDQTIPVAASPLDSFKNAVKAIKENKKIRLDY